MPQIITVLDSGDDASPPPSRLEIHQNDSQRGSLKSGSEDSPTVESVANQVLEIVQDVDPTHLHLLVTEFQLRVGAAKCTEHVLHALLDSGDYPRVSSTASRKRKRTSSEDLNGDQSGKILRATIDYSDMDRQHHGGPLYNKLSIEQLGIDFPLIPKVYIRRKFVEHNSFYAPTHLFFIAEQSRSTHEYKMKTGHRKVTAKTPVNDLEFIAEREYIENLSRELAVKRDQEAAVKLDEQENGGVECGCCFSTYPFHNMVQCVEGHLFCRECMISYAEVTLGSQSHKIVCMDQSSCKELFPESELERFLPENLIDLYNRIKQHKEVADARLDGLEECPLCDFKMVIDNMQERLFRCQNEECLSITCRQCKKLDHLPKSCKEAEEDKKLDGRHTVEEALSKALMRSCPTCGKVFIKEEGCNKMVCPCGTMSCYICRQVITGYEHFNRTPGASNSSMCPLWDGTQKINEEIRMAGERAREIARVANPNVDDVDLQVEIPNVAPQIHAAPNQRGFPLPVAVHPFPVQIPQMQPIPFQNPLQLGEPNRIEYQRVFGPPGAELVGQLLPVPLQPARAGNQRGRRHRGR